MLIINGPTIHEKCFSVQSKIAKVKETRELVSSSSPWLLGRGMENKLVMSDVGYVASFSGSFHGWNEFVTLLPDSFCVVLIHYNSHFIFLSEEFDHNRPYRSLSRISGSLITHLTLSFQLSLWVSGMPSTTRLFLLV